MPAERSMPRAGIVLATTLALLAVASAFLLVREMARARADAAAARAARVECLAADFQETLREASEGAARRAACRAWADAHAAAGSFAWTPEARLVEQDRLAAPLAERFRGYAHWNDWTALGKKNAKRGLARLEGRHVLWARVGPAVHGAVFAEAPVAEPSFVAACAGALGVIVLLFALLARALAQLVAAERRARAENAAKTTFLSNATHELKVPLAAVKLWCELLASGTADEATRAKAVRTIARQNAHMIHLVENLLDCARLEDGRRAYRIEAVDVAALARDVVAAQTGNFAAHGLACAAEGAVFAWADAAAVRQILDNLLGNAAKYAADGGPVEVAVEATGTRVALAVADRGPGIPSAARAHVFERFYRVDDSLTAEKGGLGLGLAIARGLARGMGGELTVTSRAGGGSVFTLALKRAQEEG